MATSPRTKKAATTTKAKRRAKAEEALSHSKADMIAQYQQSPKDTGSTEVQVALLSSRIAYLTKHLKDNPKDFGCRRGLLMMVGQRRRLLAYYRRRASAERYQQLLERLQLRK